ncbi:hypothetical protein MPSEU_000531000 [Mayamaea pseudoterrestris]|nr:hypothetical protein MPSEU_000531000 [Mayamaea pseudoterrestris]
MTVLSNQQILLFSAAILAMIVSSSHAALPSLTGNPSTMENQQQDKVIKTALRQRHNLPVTQAKGDRRLGATERRLPSDDKKGPSKDKPGGSDKPPSGGGGGDAYSPGYYPPPPSSGGGYYPQGGGGGGGGGGYYPPPPQSEETGGGGGGGYSPGYYPPPPSSGGDGGGGGGNYYPQGGGGGNYYPPPPSSTSAPQGGNPQNDDIPLLDDAMFDDAFYAKDACQLVTFNESFYFEAAPVQLGAGGANDLSAVGSQFIFSQNIFTPNGTLIEDTLLSGICTRTSAKGFLGTSGAGVCQFNFVDVHGNYTIAAQGNLDTMPSQTSAGNLVVTGGSGSMVSVVGEMTVVPVDETGMFTTADIFTGIYAYFIQAAFGVIICPKTGP